MSLLELSGLTASYGAAQALFGVDLAVGAGEVVALMGRNGMGKSTTVKSICRMMPSQGQLRFDGVELHSLPSHRAARLGIGLVPEGRRCFRDLSVVENLLAAARSGHWDLNLVMDFFPQLAARKKQVAGSLSGGEQQMLAIGRALMTNPRLMILDEATEGLAPIIRQQIWDAITRLKDGHHMSILVIDKSVSELAQVCDRAVILERGRTVWSGRMDELDADTSEKYVGV